MVWGTPYLCHLGSQTSLGREFSFVNKSGKIAVRPIIWMGKCYSCLTGGNNQGGKTLTLQEAAWEALQCSQISVFVSAQNYFRQSIPLEMKLHWLLQHLHSLWIPLGHRFIDFLIVDSWGPLAGWKSDSHSPCTQPDRGTGEFLLPRWCFLWSKVQFSYRRTTSRLSWEWQQLIWS